MLIWTLALVAVYGSSVAAIAYFVFSPFTSALSRKPESGYKIRLTDFIAFAFQFQIAFAAFNWLYPDFEWNVRFGVSVAAAILMLSSVSWLYGIRILRRMQIQTALRRFLTLSFVMPVGFAISISGMPIVIGRGFSDPTGLRIGVIFLTALLLRWTAIWVAKESSSGELKQDCPIANIDLHC